MRSAVLHAVAQQTWRKFSVNSQNTRSAQIFKTTAMEVDNRPYPAHRPKRTRLDSTRQRFFGTLNQDEKSLDIGGVINVLKACDDFGGGINCSVCGKLYKSKVCLTKHLWEHSVYWDLFDGEKNHDRVLSIQAALILYSGYHGYLATADDMASLLVTAPHTTTEKKREKDVNGNDVSPLPITERKNGSPKKSGSPSKRGSPYKRRRSNSGSMSC